MSGDRGYPNKGAPIALPVMNGPAVRPSRMSRRRAAVLIAVHLLIIGHAIQWLVIGRTLSPVEPSETMYTLNRGYLNAGAIFFAASILATLIFGRFFCGWGCHLVAYQDLCAWVLRKMRIRPKPMRSRFLYYAPLALALYMFVWPTVYRWVVGLPAPEMTNHVLTTNFWATFPGPGVAILTFAVCGFAIVYFLGAKGFCTYACPYGGFFALADKVSTGRIVVSEACDHSGHCTSACTSNVRVHEEVARYGMVVDPGCMKCMDCVSVCPNDALSFAFAKPSVAKIERSPAAKKPPKYDFTLIEEIAMVAVGLVALVIFRGLYGKIPLLLAMGLAGMTAFAVARLWRMLFAANVRWQQLSLKRGGAWSASGGVFVTLVVLFLLFAGHSGVVQYNAYAGQRLTAGLALGDDVWLPGSAWSSRVGKSKRRELAQATAHLERAEAWGLLPTPAVLNDLVWLYLANGRDQQAEQTVRTLIELEPGRAEVHRGLAGVLRKMGRPDEAETSYRKALELDPSYAQARGELAGMLITSGRTKDAMAEYDKALKLDPDNVSVLTQRARLLTQLHRFNDARDAWGRVTLAAPDSAEAFASLGMARIQAGDVPAGVDALRRAVELDPENPQYNYNLALVILRAGDAKGAIEYFRAAIAANANFALAHYNLSVALFMMGKPADALPEIKEAIRLAPADKDARGFKKVIERELGGGN